jgi:DNA-binding NarL/FixJ family response regulator
MGRVTYSELPSLVWSKNPTITLPAKKQIQLESRTGLQRSVSFLGNEGEEAIALCRKEEPDVVLMDGISATREIKALLEGVIDVEELEYRPPGES